MLKFLKRNYKRVIIIVILLVIILMVASGGKKKNQGVSKYTIDRGNVVNELVLSGEVEPVDEVSMAFPAGGLVQRVYKKVGEPVYKGEKIAELDNRSLYADLADAQAALSIQRADSTATQNTLDKTIAEQDTLVRNALVNLMSDDLEAITNDSFNTHTPPQVSGAYNSSETGYYAFDIVSSVGASKLAMQYYGLEYGKRDIEYNKPIPLGARGLFITFERDEVTLNDEWEIDVPNLNGSSYVTNYNAYQSALAARDLAINNAKEELNQDGSQSSIANARIKQAEASVAKIAAQIAERTLIAPFAGVVGSIDLKEGEIATSGEVVAKIFSKDAFQVVVEVPEVDVINTSAGLPANIKLDAYGDEKTFSGMISSIDASQTEVDGVSVYKARVDFNEADDNIRSGMTADVYIKKDEHDDVVRAPQRFIDSDDVGQFVLVQNAEGKNDKVYITTGLVGSDGFIEVAGGLQEGDIVIGNFAE